MFYYAITTIAVFVLSTGITTVAIIVTDTADIHDNINEDDTRIGTINSISVT